MKIFPLLILLFSTSVLAEKVGTLEQRLAGYKCQKEIKKLSESWNATGKWKGHLLANGNIALKRPTSQFAHWIVLEKVGDQESMTLMDPKTAQKVVLDNKCNSELTVSRHQQFSNPQGMNDERLLGLFLKNKSGVIVLWSPGMNHSWTAIERFQKISQEKKLPVSFVMDPFADEKNAQAEAQKRGIKLDVIYKLSSLELALRDASMHYPNFFLYKDGAIVSNVLPGLMSEEKYNSKIKQYLGKP